MKYKNNGSYYIPDFVNEKTGKVDRYEFVDNGYKLNMISDHAGRVVRDLKEQYENFTNLEVIDELIDKAYLYASSNGLNPDFCQHYFGKKDEFMDSGYCIEEGIVVDRWCNEDLVPMKITTTDYDGKLPVVQRKIDFLYDVRDQILMFKKVIEVSKINDEVVSVQYGSPKSLSKIHAPIWGSRR